MGGTINHARLCIIEFEDGLSVRPSSLANRRKKGPRRTRESLVDSGPYAAYEEAYDTLCELEGEEEDRWGRTRILASTIRQP